MRFQFNKQPKVDSKYDVECEFYHNIPSKVRILDKDVSLEKSKLNAKQNFITSSKMQMLVLKYNHNK